MGKRFIVSRLFPGIICLMLLPQWLLGQAKLVVQTDAQRVAPGAYLQVQFTVEQASKVTSFRPPDFAGFSVTHGPSYTSGWTLVNGEMKEYVAISFLLQPVRTGKLTIAPAVAVVEGKTLRSTPLSVEVLAAANAPAAPPAAQNAGDQPLNDMILRKGESVPGKIKNNLFVRLEVSKRSVFVGEPIVATYKLYTRLNSESRVAKRPSFSGFSVFDMTEPESDKVQTERWNGKDYNVYLLRMVQLYPLQAGTYTLESMQVDNTVRFIKGSAASGQNTMNGILGAIGQESLDPSAWINETVSVENLPVSVTVKPLPVAGQPDSFSGAVGRFSLRATPPGDSLVLGKAYQFSIALEGRGNMPMIAAPALQWSDAWESFDPETRFSIQQEYSPFTGTKTYTIPFTPRRVGKFFLPAASLSYFDPSTQQYVRLRTDALPVQVVDSGETMLPAGPGAVGHTPSGAASPGGGGKFRWIVWVGLTLGSLWVLVLFRRRRKQSQAPTPAPLESYPEANPEPVTQLQLFPAKHNLDQARSWMLDGDAPRCYQEIIRVFRTVLAERYHLDAYASRVSLAEQLSGRFPDTKIPESLTALMDHCQQAVYAPLADAAALEADFAQAVQLLDLLQPGEGNNGLPA